MSLGEHYEAQYCLGDGYESDYVQIVLKKTGEIVCTLNTDTMWRLSLWTQEIQGRYS